MKSSWTVKAATVFGLAMILFSAGCAGKGSSSTPVTTGTVATSATSTTATASAAVKSTATSTAPSGTPVTTQVGPYGGLRMGTPDWQGGHFEAPLLAVAAANYLFPMFDMMIWIDQKGNPAPGIVENFQLASDGLSWIYSIRKGVKFHNGDDLTADDVKFSIEQYMRKDAPMAETRNAVDRVDKVDAYTLRVYTKGVQPYLPTLQTLNTAGSVMPKAYIDSKGWSVARQSPVGSGPFKFIRSISGDSVQYEAMDKHWRQTASFKTLDVITMPEETTRIAAMKTGQLDITDISLDKAAALETAGFQTFPTGVIMPSLRLHGALDPRGVGLPVYDVRVRQALNMAINREDIMKNFLYGKGTPPMPPYYTETSPEIDVPYWKNYIANAYRYDPATAKKLISDAGFPNGFSLKIYTYPDVGGVDLPKLAEIISANWKAIGVNAEVNLIALATYSAWRVGEDKTLVGQAVTSKSLSGQTSARALSLLWHSKGNNKMILKGMPELDKQIDAIFAETDANKRRDLLAVGIKMATDTYAFNAISSVPSLGAAAPRVDMTAWPLPMGVPYYGPYVAFAQHK